MRNDRIAWGGGALLVGLAAVYGLPRLVSQGRKALRRATGTTFRSGASEPGVRASADPARGFPA
ncbi:hypothetical protein [Sphingosinicella terrae]|uniref:hypothetical protein n=1 Tax=Sphingosinicella terrae TaxID=2172047 RepID=UPI000E0CD42F|nr:hypothetical protein [Sphingosinicella terrae]